MIKNILAVIGIVAIVLLLAFLAGLFLVLPRMLQAAPPLKPDIVSSSQGMQLSMTINEGDVNAKLAEMPELADRLGQVIQMKTKNLRVKLEKDSVTAALDADIWGDGTWVPVTVKTKVFVSQGKPAVELERVTVGVMPFPSSFVAQLSTKANERLSALDLKLPMDLKEIKVEDGKITVRGTMDISKVRFQGGKLFIQGIN